MAVKRDEVNLQVTMNAKQAGNSLKDLQKEARDLRRALERIPVGTKEFDDAAAKLRTVNQQISEAQAKTKALGSAFKDTGAEVGRLRGVLQGVLAVFGGLNLNNLVQGLSAWVVQLFDIGTALDAAQAKTRTVFGDAEVVVKGFAETNAQSLGLARQEYVDLATSAGDLLKPMGFTEAAVANLSVSLTDQAGILAEWSKGKVNTEQASEILTKSLLGERDALNTLGIDIKDSLIQDEIKRKGLQELTGAERRQAEALITLEQITKQSASANEAYAKNTDSLTRRKAELRARIAEVSTTAARLLIPAFSLVINVGLKLIDWGVRFAKTLAAIPAFIRDNQVALVALSVGLVTMNGEAILAAANTLRLAVAQRAATIATTAQAAAQRVLNLVLNANPIGLVVTALSFLVAAFSAAYENSETFRRVVSGVFAAVTASVQNAIGFFSDFGSGLKNLFEGNFQAAADAFAASFNRINPAQIGTQMAIAYKAGYESVPAPNTDVKVDTKESENTGNKVGEAMAKGFTEEFKNLTGKTISQLKKEAADLRKYIESLPTGSDKYTAAQQRLLDINNKISQLSEAAKKKREDADKAAKEALDLRLKEIELAYLKEELVADNQRAKGHLNESNYARQILILKKQQYQQQLTALGEFNQQESKEAIAAQKALLEIQQQLTPKKVSGLAPVETRTQLGQVSSQTAGGLAGADVSAANDPLALRQKFAEILTLEQANEVARLDIQRNSLNARLEFLRNAGLQETEVFQTTLAAKLKADEDYQAKKLENERRTEELRKQIQETSYETAADFFQLGIDLLSQDEKARKKNAGAIKAFQIAQVIVQGVSEVQKIWATAAELGPIAGPILGALLTALAVGRTGLAISKISSTKFARGGMAKMGFFGGKSHSAGGNKGVFEDGTAIEVEKDEAFAIVNKRNAPLLRTLSAVNAHGGHGVPFFARGGLPRFDFGGLPTVNTTPQPQSLALAAQPAQQNMMQFVESVKRFEEVVRAFPTEVKSRVVYTELTQVASEVQRVQDDASF